MAILGGAKVTDKIGVIDRLLELADTILIGGAMCFPFFRAQGHATGDSLCEEEGVEPARAALETSDADARPVLCPSDLVLGDRFAADARAARGRGVEVPDGWMGLDIGRDTADALRRADRRGGTVFWNGPMGAFELPPFAAGTRAVARGGRRCDGHDDRGRRRLGRGARAFGLDDKVDHVSTGGGASLELVEGKPLPGVEVLR